MPFGSRRVLAGGRSVNPDITTLTFDSPQGGGSSQPQLFTSVTISGDTAGNTVNGNGTYNVSGTPNLAAGITGGANNPICVPLTEGRTYTLRLSKQSHGTISSGLHPTATYPYTDTRPRLSTIKSSSDADDSNNVSPRLPQIKFAYDRVRNNSGPPAYQTGDIFFTLSNHDTSSDVMSGDGHIFNFTSTGGSSNDKAMVNPTLTLDQNFVVASGDNATSGSFTAKGLILQYQITNYGDGVAGDVTLELFQS